MFSSVAFSKRILPNGRKYLTALLRAAIPWLVSVFKNGSELDFCLSGIQELRVLRDC
jgi:hypothetical protein